MHRTVLFNYVKTQFLVCSRQFPVGSLQFLLTYYLINLIPGHLYREIASCLTMTKRNLIINP